MIELRRITLSLGLFLLLSVAAHSQTNDTAAIKQAALNYVEGFFNADWQRVSKAVSPELVKRIIIKDTLGNFAISNMGASQLIYSAKHNKNTNILNPGQPFKADVIIYDIYGKTATAKVVTNKFKFVDYLHLGKIDGEWKIVNVLWELLQ
jgi:hypothetical protein